MRSFKNLLKRTKGSDSIPNLGVGPQFGVNLEELVNRTKCDIPSVVEHTVLSLEELGKSLIKEKARKIKRKKRTE